MLEHDLVSLCKVVLICNDVKPSEYFLLCLGGGGSIRLCVRMLAKIILVSFTGMLEYKMVMSIEARLLCGSMRV